MGSPRKGRKSATARRGGYYVENTSTATRRRTSIGKNPTTAETTTKTEIKGKRHAEERVGDYG
jgi:hypothetical protein